MANKPLPSPEELRQFLFYDIGTGRVFWMERRPEDFAANGSVIPPEVQCSRWNGRYAGREAFCKRHVEGYLCGQLGGRYYLTHRVAWAIAHGRWPDGMIDHINRVRTDNRLVNLRLATPRENNLNRSLDRKTSKYLGVSLKSGGPRWLAQIKVDGAKMHIGYFATEREAAEAYDVFAVQLYGNRAERNFA